MLLITKKYVWCNGNISTTVRLSYHRITITNWTVKHSMAENNELSNDMESFGRDCNTHIYHISTLIMISMYWKCFIHWRPTIWYKRMIYYIVHNSKQKIDDRKILMFIYESYLKESKKHARVLWKDTFISIWSQYLLIQIRKWIYVTTFKTTPLTEMNNGVK